MTRILIVIFFFLVTSYSNAQYKFNSLGIEDGLPHDKIITIKQDKSGFIWLGTRDGIVRYDGMELKVMRPEKPKKTSRVDNHIVAICPGSDGNVWFSTFQPGIYRYSILKDEIDYFPLNAEGRIHARDRIISIKEDLDGNLWMGTIGEMLTFDTKEFKFKRIKGVLHVNALSVNDNSTIWIYEPKNGFKLLDKEGKIIKHHKLPEDSGEFYFRYGTIVKDELNTLWAGAENALYKFDSGADSWIKVLDFKSPIMNIVFRENGELWIATAQNGVFVYNRYAEELRRVEAVVNDTEKLDELSLHDIYIDGSDVVYVASSSGVHIMDWSKQFFHFLPSTSRIEEFHTINYGGRLLESTGNTLFNLTPSINGSDIGQFKFKDLIAKKKIKEKVIGSYSHKDASCILQVKDGFYIGTIRHGLWFCSFNSNSSYKIDIPYDIFNPRTDIINDIAVDFKNNIWLACSHGVIKIPESLDKNQFVFFSGKDGEAKVLSGARCKALYLDRHGWLWIGTLHSGITKINSDTEEIVFLKRDDEVENSLSNNSISCIYEDSKGFVWVGTNGGGLNKYDRESNSFTTFSVEDGLGDNEICGVLEDNAGNLWVSHLNGMSRINLENSKIINYSKTDLGIREPFIKRNVAKLEDGTLVFGSINGFTVIAPSIVVENNKAPQVFVDNVFINGLPYKNHPGKIDIERYLTGVHDIRLKRKPTSLAFGVHALSFVSYHKNRIQYCWNDSEWHELNPGEETISISKFRTGSNILKLKAANNDLVWSDIVEVNVVLSVKKYLASLVFVIALLTGLVIVLLRYRIQKKRKTIDFKRLRNQNPELDVDTLKDEVQKLKILLKNEKPFLNSKLTLKELANKLNMPSSHLSYLLNEVMDTNFNDLINSYRIDYIIELMQDPENQKVTLLSLAFEAGFNSKASFFRIFKKQTGKTPSEYYKQLIIKK